MSINYARKVGFLFYLWRQHKHLSQKEAARKAGVQQHYWSEVERGHRDLRLQTMERMITGMQITLEDFFKGPQRFSERNMLKIKRRKEKDSLTPLEEMPNYSPKDYYFY